MSFSESSHTQKPLIVNLGSTVPGRVCYVGLVSLSLILNPLQNAPQMTLKHPTGLLYTKLCIGDSMRKSSNLSLKQEHFVSNDQLIHTTVSKLIGTPRSLRTTWSDPRHFDDRDMTALDMVRALRRYHLWKDLAPVLYHTVPFATLNVLETRFRDLIIRDNLAVTTLGESTSTCHNYMSC